MLAKNRKQLHFLAPQTAPRIQTLYLYARDL